MPLLVAALADRLADARRGRDAEIGLDQHVLEIVERGGVELALGEDVGDAAADRRRRAREARAQALPASFASAPAGADGAGVRSERLRRGGASAAGGGLGVGRGRRDPPGAAAVSPPAEPAAEEARLRRFFVVALVATPQILNASQVGRRPCIRRPACAQPELAYQLHP